MTTDKSLWVGVWIFHALNDTPYDADKWAMIRAMEEQYPDIVKQVGGVFFVASILDDPRFGDGSGDEDIQAVWAVCDSFKEDKDDG